MKLFDTPKDLADEIAGYTEPNFTYLNRTLRKEFIRIRILLEEWFSRYPSGEQYELRNRFRSQNNIQHQAAFFELFLHELLLQFKCKVKLHPSLNETEKVPDFLVEFQTGERFYLEATVVTGESANQAAARARENTVYEVLDRLVISPDYFLSLSVSGAPKTPPPAKTLAAYINNQLNLLNYDAMIKNYNDNGAKVLPNWHFDHDGWHIDIRPIPKSNLRGKTGVRPIGTRIQGFNWVDNRTPIRDSIIEKGRKYGELDLPYVVAVNALEPADDIDVLEALFGKEVVSINISDDSTIMSEPKYSRKPDGAWIGPKGPRYTRISAVLMVTQLSTYNIPRALLCLYHNPWAQMPYRSVLTKLPQAIPLNGEIHMEKGKKIYTIFNLTSTWPESTA